MQSIREGVDDDKANGSLSCRRRSKSGERARAALIMTTARPRLISALMFAAAYRRHVSSAPASIFLSIRYFSRDGRPLPSPKTVRTRSARGLHNTLGRMDALINTVATAADRDTAFSSSHRHGPTKTGDAVCAYWRPSEGTKDPCGLVPTVLLQRSYRDVCNTDIHISTTSHLDGKETYYIETDRPPKAPSGSTPLLPLALTRGLHYPLPATQTLGPSVTRSNTHGSLKCQHAPDSRAKGTWNMGNDPQSDLKRPKNDLIKERMLFALARRVFHSNG